MLNRKRKLLSNTKPDGVYQMKVVGVGNLTDNRIFVDLDDGSMKVYRASFPKDWEEWHPLYRMLAEAGYSDSEIVEFDLNDLIDNAVEITVASKERNDKVYSNVTDMVVLDADTESTETNDK